MTSDGQDGGRAPAKVHRGRRMRVAAAELSPLPPKRVEVSVGRLKARHYDPVTGRKIPKGERGA